MEYQLLLQTKTGEIWKTASKIYIKKSGTWREIKNIFIKKNGEWLPIKRRMILPDNPYASLTPCYFDTWGIDLSNGNKNGWNSTTMGFQAFYSRFYNQHAYFESIKHDKTELAKLVSYLVGIAGSETDFSNGDTKAVYFYNPPLAGWSDKQCYIKNNNSWFELVNAKNVDSGWYKLTFNGSSFSCSK